MYKYAMNAACMHCFVLVAHGCYYLCSLTWWVGGATVMHSLRLAKSTRHVNNPIRANAQLA